MDVAAQLERLYRTEFRRLFATLVRLIGDFDLAEDMLQEAFVIAGSKWPDEGVPENPGAWLVSVARHKAIDVIRREQRMVALSDEHLESDQFSHEPEFAEEGIEDDRLRLIFTCCHPALDQGVQVALTLREVCGLQTDAVAAAFLVQPSTMAQRLVRGKAKIRADGIPYAVPEASDMPERLDAVLAVIYLVYNAGYRALSGEQLTSPQLADEAIRLGRLLKTLLPEPEVLGLLALMLLHESRRKARSSARGELVLLEDQDRSLWDLSMVQEGLLLLAAALQQGAPGPYTLQAAIVAEHARAASSAETDWARIVQCYDLLLKVTASPVVALNRAVAVAMRDGPEAGLKLLESLQKEKVLATYHPLQVAMAELYRRAGRNDAARKAYETALQLVQLEPERRHLQKRLASL